MRKSYFAGLHPVVNLIYLLTAIFITMMTMNPVIIILSLAASFVYSCYLERQLILKKSLFIALPVLIFSTVIMPLFYHNGITVLFYVNDMQVTLEAVIYGLTMSMLLIAVVQWFWIWNIWISSEKFLYLFSRISPSVALILSMIFRMIPLMKSRFRQIHEAQKGIFGDTSDTGITGRARQLTKELSILISWCLENSIDTSISMESRGYGTGKRSSYSIFRIHDYDLAIIGICIVLSAPIIVFIAKGELYTGYFPEIYMCGFKIKHMTAIAAYIIYLFFPLAADIINNSRCLFRDYKR